MIVYNHNSYSNSGEEADLGVVFVFWFGPVGFRAWKFGVSGLGPTTTELTI